MLGGFLGKGKNAAVVSTFLMGAQGVTRYKRYVLRVTSYELQVTSYKLQVANGSLSCVTTATLLINQNFAVARRSYLGCIFKPKFSGHRLLARLYEVQHPRVIGQIALTQGHFAVGALLFSQKIPLSLFTEGQRFQHEISVGLG